MSYHVLIAVFQTVLWLLLIAISFGMVKGRGLKLMTIALPLSATLVMLSWIKAGF